MTKSIKVKGVMKKNELEKVVAGEAISCVLKEGGIIIYCSSHNPTATAAAIDVIRADNFYYK